MMSGHGAVHLLVASAAEVGFRWDLLRWVGLVLGYLC